MNMLKKAVCFFTVLTAVFMAGIFSPAVFADTFLDDTANLYDDGDEKYLNSKMEEASAETGWHYAIVTTDKNYSNEYNAGMEAERIYKEQFGTESGVLFLCDTGWRYVVVAGTAESYVTGQRFDNMISAMADHYFDYDDIGCAEQFINDTVRYYNKGEGGDDVSSVVMLAAVAIGLVAAVATGLGVNSSYSHHEKPITNNYMDRRKLDFYRRMDTHVNTRRTVIHRHDQNNGGSSGGSGIGGSFGGGGFGGKR